MGFATLRAYSWRLTSVASEEDVSVASSDVTSRVNIGFGGFGYQQFVTGLPKITFDVEAYWDTTLNPFTGPIYLYPGQENYVVLYIDKETTNSAWTFPAAVFTRVEMTEPVRGPISYSFSGTSGVNALGIRAPYTYD